MQRILLDENFNNDIMRGLLRRNDSLDILRVQDVPALAGMDDPTVLAWAAQDGRIVFTHDVNTMTHFAYERIRAGEAMPGVFEVNRSIPIGRVIEDMLLVIECSEDGEWEGQVCYLPLS